MDISKSEQAPGQNKTYSIIVNGRLREVTGKSISYRDVIQLAFPDDQSNDAIEYTVAYANSNGKDGTLVEGQTTHIKEGMIGDLCMTTPIFLC